jgi:hypothetical protein
MNSDIVQLVNGGHLLWFESADARKSGLLLSQYLNLSRIVAEKSPEKVVNVLIVAGEANEEEYRVGDEAFRALLKLQNVHLEFAAGPVLSSDKQNRSTVLEMATNFPDSFKRFYQFITRVDEHWKATVVDGSPSLLQVELPHRAVPEYACKKATISKDAYFFGAMPSVIFMEPLGKEVPFDRVFEINSRRDGIIEAIPRDAEQREALRAAFVAISRSKLEWFDQFYRKRVPSFEGKEVQKKIPVLPTEALQRVEQWMRERGGSYDSANVLEILDSHSAQLSGKGG